MTEDEALEWAKYFKQERAAGNPNALNRANARLALYRMNKAAK
jgi:hypothetical protein